MSDRKPILEIESLSISYKEQLLLKGLSFSINSNEIVAIVGESGSGKSLTALSIAGLLFQTPFSISSFALANVFVVSLNLSNKK